MGVQDKQPRMHTDKHG